MGAVRHHTEQDLYLTALTWRRLVGETGEWTNRIYLRANDKISAEGEAYPDLVPEGTPAPDVPVRERLITVTEKETDMRVSATAGVFYQSPRFLVRAASPENFAIENERITHVSVGFERYFGPDWSRLVEPYYQWLDNLVVEQERSSGRVTNDGEGTNLGLDVVLSRSFKDGWFGNVAYAYNDARIDDNDGFGEYDADFNREHFFSIGGSWEISERWQVGARWKWATGRPTDDFITRGGA